MTSPPLSAHRPDFSRLMAPPPLRRSGAPQVPAHAVTEDTPADMLTGQMSLSVLLPDGRHCRMNVDRGTPMMDLLIQVATANKISPGGHVIQVISDRSHSCLSYKPSTPIGTLDTTALRIVPKNKINELPSRRTKPPPQNPMADAKIRIKVYLPRNQLSAMRVSPKTPLAEVLDQICKDKNLDVSRYELRHPVNVDERLRPSCCLADYKLQEVTVVPLNSRTNTVLSSADIIAMQKKSDGKRKIFAIFGKKSKPSVIESTASSDSLGERSVSPDGSDESADRPRSLSPQPPQVIQAPPRAKKRAAPKPPQVNGVRTTYVRTTYVSRLSSVRSVHIWT
ncbi:Protein cordon-bleu [Amphibalanus amphitrite]|uniref:Protein cordon-bleu n=1 Tax=Amphibalanus amphitrite TaxID=1232801 RepID=A0A6A4VQ79_AMPAM|nr:Protein cordon-bleu [Amphibalanus amphitrite]